MPTREHMLAKLRDTRSEIAKTNVPEPELPGTNLRLPCGVMKAGQLVGLEAQEYTIETLDSLCVKMDELHAKNGNDNYLQFGRFKIKGLWMLVVVGLIAAVVLMIYVKWTTTETRDDIRQLVSEIRGGQRHERISQ